jgi:hypothetical protein
MKRILVHEGGGVKGYMSSYVLKRLEEEHGLLGSYYDLMTGSSTGAISTSLMASEKLDAKSLNSMYAEMVKRVFEKPWYPHMPPIYQRKNFIEVWEQLIDKNFKMNQCACKLMLTSLNLCDSTTHFFKSWEMLDGNMFLIDAVINSAISAPLYFDPVCDDYNKAVWSDGGMGYYNLNLDTCLVESILQGWIEEGIFIDIVGCGFSYKTFPYEKVKKWGVIKELMDYFRLDDGGIARAVSKQDQIRKMQKLSEKINIKFRYWDVEIPQKIDKLDGVKFLKEYSELGKKMADKPYLEN